MFDDIKLRLLQDKFNVLMRQELELMKEGKTEEAEKVSREITETSNKIQKITEKKLDKTAKKSDKLTARIDNKIREFDAILGVTDEEAEEELASIMRRQ